MTFWPQTSNRPQTNLKIEFPPAALSRDPPLVP
jgi:hypothetical protein